VKLHVNVAATVHENGIVQELGAKLGQYECISETGHWLSIRNFLAF